MGDSSRKSVQKSTHIYRSENHGMGRTCKAGTETERLANSYDRKHDGRKTDHPPKSPDSPMGTQPKWVQTPSMTSHSGFLTRASSDWGSRRFFQSTWRASSISPCVRCRMNTGLPRHLMIAFLPSGMPASSTSTLASASTSAEADIVPRNSVTLDLATEAESTPMEPITKYDSARFPAGEEAWYELMSGTSGASRRGTDVCMVRWCALNAPLVGTGFHWGL